MFQVKDSAAHVNLLIIKGVGHPRHVKRQTVRWDGKIFWRGPASPQTRGPAARGACGCAVCLFCMSGVRVVVARPCRHTRKQSCSQLVRDCPISRQPIDRAASLPTASSTARLSRVVAAKIE